MPDTSSMDVPVKLSQAQQKQVEKKLEEMFTLHSKKFPEYLSFAKQGIKSIVANTSTHFSLTNVTLTLIGTNDVVQILYDNMRCDVTACIADSSKAAYLRTAASSSMPSAWDSYFKLVMFYVSDDPMYR